MSRKHYTAIAAAFKNQIAQIDAEYADEPTSPCGIAAIETVRRLAQDFARIAVNDNPNFDTRRFLAACGIN